MEKIKLDPTRESYYINSRLDARFKYAEYKFKTFEPKLGYESLITKYDIRESIDIMGGYGLRDVFIKEWFMSVNITLVIKSEYWHYRFIIYHDVFKMLWGRLPMGIGLALDCLELVNEDNHMKKGFGQRFKSVLTIKKENLW
jgi:hypothetical protein